MLRVTLSPCKKTSEMRHRPERPRKASSQVLTPLQYPFTRLCAGGPLHHEDELGKFHIHIPHVIVVAAIKGSEVRNKPPLNVLFNYALLQDGTCFYQTSYRTYDEASLRFPLSTDTPIW
jgi:hypothetical protein